MKKVIRFWMPAILFALSSVFFTNCIEDESAGSFTDKRDGNVYKWIKIGNQVWMAENLRYLPSVDDPKKGSETTPYYYVYGYYGTNASEAKATENYKTYGVLYNWPAAVKACPKGWRLPSNEEWKDLIEYLGGIRVAGGKLKATTLWKSPNKWATNESGFTALPGGARNTDREFAGIGEYGYWWSSTNTKKEYPLLRLLCHNNGDANASDYDEKGGLSVRCIKN